MKQKYLNWVLAAIFICSSAVTMVSCSKYEEQVTDIVSSLSTKNHRITAEQATQNALNFVGRLGGATRSNGMPLSVAEVKAIGVNENKTRSANDSINVDSLFYVINFNDNKGFVIAASDDREVPVFAYVEEGKYEDSDTLNNGYNAFICSLIETEIYRRTQQMGMQNEGGGENGEDDEDHDPNFDDGGGGGGNSNNKKDKFEVMTPLLVTKWDQSYSTYCPGNYTGCVVTAVSQICSYLKAPDYVTWSYNGTGDQCYINWDRIENECISNGGNPTSYDLKDQIAKLMRFWGVVFDAEYTSTGTSVDSDNAISKMRDLGYNATKLGDYNATNVIEDLKKGNRIVFMRGNARYYHVGFVFRKYVDGHAWVVDGYIHSIENNKESLYIHCNWGWKGGRDGFFLSNILNTEESLYYDDNTIKMEKDYYFRYKLKTSTICK